MVGIGISTYKVSEKEQKKSVVVSCAGNPPRPVPIGYPLAYILDKMLILISDYFASIAVVLSDRFSHHSQLLSIVPGENSSVLLT